MMYLLPIDIEDMATDRLRETLKALRNAVRYRNPETGRRHFCHGSEHRAVFADGIKQRRDELRRRNQ